MKFQLSKRGNDIAGVGAAIILALASLVACIYHTKILLDLNGNGVSAEALVVDIERGARNSKWAVYRFETESMGIHTTRDKFLQYIKRVKKGDVVQVIYDKNNPKLVTADLGPWTWQAPAIFGSAFVLLVLLPLLIWRHSKPATP